MVGIIDSKVVMVSYYGGRPDYSTKTGYSCGRP